MKKYVSIKSAIVVNSLGKYSTVALQLLYTAILSRILTPEDYGTVAVVNVFIVFFQLMADMGFGSAVIQFKNLTEKNINHIFSVMIYFGLLLMIAFMGFSHVIAYAYGNTVYVSLGFILSFSLALNCFNIIPNAVMLKEKMFIEIAVRTVSVALCAMIVAVFMAKNGFGVYALVFYSVMNSAGLFLWNEISTKLKFTFKPKFGPLKMIWSYSIYQFGAQTLNYFNRNLDSLLIGKFFSTEALGYYNKAYMLMQFPINYLPGVITPVLHPILSEYQNNKTVIYEKYILLLRALSLLGCFGGAFCFFCGEEIIYIVFGNQWGEAIQPFKILSLSLWMQIMTNTIAPIYQSIGNTRLMFKNLCVTTLIVVCMIITGVVMKSIIFVSIFVTIAYALNFFVTFYFLIHKGFGNSFFNFLKKFKADLVIYIVLMTIALIWRWDVSSVVLSFFIKLFVMFGCFAIMILITKQYRVLTKVLKRNI